MGILYKNDLLFVDPCGRAGKDHIKLNSEALGLFKKVADILVSKGFDITINKTDKKPRITTMTHSLTIKDMN